MGDDHRRVEGDAAPRAQAQSEIGVLPTGGVALGVEAADGDEDLASHRDIPVGVVGAGHRQAAAAGEVVEGIDRHAVAESGRRVGVVDRALHRADRGIGERADALRDPLGVGRAVAADEEQQRGIGLRAGAVDAGAQPATRTIAHDADAAAAGERVGDRGGAVGAGVVDHHHVEVVEAVGEQGGQRPPELPLLVAHGDDDADGRHGCGSTRPILEAARMRNPVARRPATGRDDRSGTVTGTDLLRADGGCRRRHLRGDGRRPADTRDDLRQWRRAQGHQPAARRRAAGRVRDIRWRSLRWRCFHRGPPPR